MGDDTGSEDSFEQESGLARADVSRDTVARRRARGFESLSPISPVSAGSPPQPLSPIISRLLGREILSGSVSRASSPGFFTPTIRSEFFRRDLAIFTNIREWAGSKPVTLVFGKYTSRLREPETVDVPFIYAHGFPEVNHSMAMLFSALNNTRLLPLDVFDLTIYHGVFPAALLANNNYDAFTNLGVQGFAGCTNLSVGDFSSPRSPVSPLAGFTNSITTPGRKVSQLHLSVYADAASATDKWCLAQNVIEILARLGMPRVAVPAYINLGGSYNATGDCECFGRVREFLSSMDAHEMPLFQKDRWRVSERVPAISFSQSTAD